MSSYSYISNAHPSVIESLYRDYQKDAASIDQDWRKFFEGFDFGNLYGNGHSDSKSAISPSQITEELKVYQLIHAYRQKAHLLSDTNPIRQRKDRKPHLDLVDFGLQESDLGKSFSAGQELGLGTASLQTIIDKLQKIYVRSLGFEYTYVTDPKAFEWLRTRIENPDQYYGLNDEQRKHIFKKLNKAVSFEQFLGKKYIGQKRFSLEGCEATIPAIDAIINSIAPLGVKELVIGMAHRGRLNVLVNILQKTYKQVFSEFEGQALPEGIPMGGGDVKYHLGYTSQIQTQTGETVSLQLMPNPSHLEAVDAVVQGFARAQADLIHNSHYDSILPVLIHGDAAIAGQGIVYEVAQMSQLEGYHVGGTIHIVINNQIGFTTDFDDARSSEYCTSLARVVKAPVIHVNGDDVEAVVFAAKLVAEYRQEFNSDIYLDILGYRKHGHNEGDAPEFTQPKLYSLIRNHPNVLEIYEQKLDKAHIQTQEISKKLKKTFNNLLQKGLDAVRQTDLPYTPHAPEIAWNKLRRSTRADFDQSPITGISQETFDTIIKGLFAIPDDFKMLKKVKKILDKHHNSVQKNTLDWATAELLAYGSILLQGSNVRMSGEDVKRGTFAHRHAVVLEKDSDKEFNRLSHLSDDQEGQFLIYNSLLSEYAVLGFEFGYALASPETLTLWEAQFGDFANGAQIIIDQFISASEAKWNLMNGLVMLLPHGYEGMGPEHSSARLERFLQLSSQCNMIVANITEPSNFFHALRRQQTWQFRKPLIVMSPKSLFRHPKCISPVSDILSDTNFKELIDDPFIKNPSKVRKVLFCSGKFYYDLAAEQTAKDVQDVAIVRLEQLYPLPRKAIEKVIARYKGAELVWVQEEPANMGALWHIGYRLRDLPLTFIARRNSASPATGFKEMHTAEQKDLVNRAFA